MPITALAFILFFIFAIIAMIVTDLSWGFYLYQMVYFLNPDSRWWGQSIPGMRYSFTVVVMMLFFYLYRKKQYQQNKIFDTPQTKWIVLIYLSLCFVYFFSIDPVTHQVALYDLFKLYVILFVAYKIIDNEKKFTLMLWFYLFGCAYIGWEAYNTGRTDQGRLEGIGMIDAPDANGFAAAIAPAIPLLMYWGFYGEKVKHKMIAAVLGAFIVNALILINSRGAFLGVAVGSFYFLISIFLSKYRKTGQRLKIVLLIVAALGAAYSLTDDIFWERMSTLQQIEDESKSGSHRYRMWLATFDMIGDRPLGLGVNGFKILSPYYVDEYLFHKGQIFKAVHSSWCQALAESGWPGFFAYIALIISTLRVAEKTKRHLKQSENYTIYFLIIALQAALITFIVSGTFINRFRAEVLYWLIMFIGCAANIFLYKYSKQNEKT